MARERRRRRGGSEAKSDSNSIPKAPAYIKRKIPHYSILSDDDLSIIEENADTMLEEIGIVFSEDQEALDILEKAGASVDGMRVRFPRGIRLSSLFWGSSISTRACTLCRSYSMYST